MLFEQKLKALALLALISVSHRAEASKTAVELSFAVSSNLKSVSLAYAPWKITITNSLDFGVGARSTVFASQGATFVTAEPAELTANRKEFIHSDDFVVSATNVMFFSVYELSNALGLSFNLDLVGFSFGRKAELSNPVSSSDTSPSQFNRFIFDNYDRGSLNSQFLASYKFSENYKVAVGLAHQFVEYTSSQAFEFRNRRFRLKDNSLVLVFSSDCE